MVKAIPLGPFGVRMVIDGDRVKWFNVEQLQLSSQSCSKTTTSVTTTSRVSISSGRICVVWRMLAGGGVDAALKEVLRPTSGP